MIEPSRYWVFGSGRGCSPAPAKCSSARSRTTASARDGTRPADCARAAISFTRRPVSGSRDTAGLSQGTPHLTARSGYGYAFVPILVYEYSEASMTKRRTVNNLLALALLALLAPGRPMHPYEMATMLRRTGKEQDMKIKWGSLYTVVANLEKHGLIEAGRHRPGRSPPGAHPVRDHRRRPRRAARLDARAGRRPGQGAAPVRRRAVGARRAPAGRGGRAARAAAAAAGRRDRGAARGAGQVRRRGAAAVPDRVRVHPGDPRRRGRLDPLAAGRAGRRQPARPGRVAGLARHPAAPHRNGPPCWRSNDHASTGDGRAHRTLVRPATRLGEPAGGVPPPGRGSDPRTCPPAPRSSRWRRVPGYHAIDWPGSATR